MMWEPSILSDNPSDSRIHRLLVHSMHSQPSAIVVVAVATVAATVIAATRPVAVTRPVAATRSAAVTAAVAIVAPVRFVRSQDLASHPLLDGTLLTLLHRRPHLRRTRKPIRLVQNRATIVLPNVPIHNGIDLEISQWERGEFQLARIDFVEHCRGNEKEKRKRKRAPPTSWLRNNS